MKDMRLWMLAALGVETVIAKYDGLLTAVTAPKASPVLSSPSVYLLNGTKAKKSARGLVIEDGRKQINQ